MNCVDERQSIHAGHRQVGHQNIHPIHIGQSLKRLPAAGCGYDGKAGVLQLHGQDHNTPVEETVQSFEAIVKGGLDDVPEQAFLNVGGVEQVLAKAKALQESAG